LQLKAYVIRRLALAVLVIFGVLSITFVITRVLPSNPAQLYVGPRATAHQIDMINAKFGFDKPLWEQYLIHMKNMVVGNWGDSLRNKTPVLSAIGRFLPQTAELVIVALSISVIIGVSLGALTAHKKGGWADHTSRLFSTAGVSIPAFWIALMLQVLVVKVFANALPVGGISDILVADAHPIHRITGSALFDSFFTGNWTAFADTVRHIILPALALAAFPAGVVMRMTRSAMLEALGNDYIRMERAMGVPERLIIVKYAMKNALAPVLTVIGLMFAYMLTSTFFIELIFAWPGLGLYATTAILSDDFPVIVGVTFVSATAYVVVNLVVDVALAWLDPRVTLN